MSKILDGKKLSTAIESKLARQIGKLRTKPKIVILQIGNLAESNTYIRNKKACGTRIGAISEHIKYPTNVSKYRIIRDIEKFNRDKRTHGIMLQLPTPKGFDTEEVLEHINPAKDVDGLTALNTKHLFDNNPAFIPATAKGILALLEEYKIKLAGKKVVIVGESALVGRPVMLAFLNKGATVTICHRDTRHLERETRLAEILVTAVGQQKLITKKHVSRGQIVVDIGINFTKEKRLVGDVDFANVKRVVRAITPVPGGVGPMTVISLFQNLLTAYRLQT